MRLFACCVSMSLVFGAAGCGQPEPAAPTVETPGVVLSPDVPVSTTGGLVQGVAAESDPDIVAFRGIPFAAPPVGDLRWRPPAAVEPWDGLREASMAGAVCPQWRGDEIVGDEDCLTLNVWAPRASVEPLPVMVWIHGGGYRLGSGGGTEGARLAAKGVVLITINYRLNVFGFLAHPALSAESPHAASGNYGVMDMVAALGWVRDNIASFGGDPGRVTIFGESAGGGAVMTLMLVPQADGLFHGGIAQSTYVHGWDRPLGAPARGWEPAEAVGVRLGEALEAAGDDSLTRLRDASTREVLEAASVGPLFRWSGTVWAPNVDGWYLPDDPVAMYTAGQQHDVPVIAGVMDNEGSLFRSRFDIEDVADFESYVRRDFDGVASDLLEHYGVTHTDDVAAGLDHLVHDMFFAGPVRLQVRAHEPLMSPAWLYRFAHVPPTEMGSAFGAHHAGELAYVFGNLTEESGAWADVDREMSDLLMSYWVQFAADGNPNRGDLPAWPPFETETETYLTLAATTVAETGLHQPGGALFDRFEAHRRSPGYAGPAGRGN